MHEYGNPRLEKEKNSKVQLDNGQKLPKFEELAYKLKRLKNSNYINTKTSTLRNIFKVTDIQKSQIQNLKVATEK